MALRLKQILTEGIAQLSYLIGDDSSRTAAVIDPRPDVDVYLRMARKYGLSITHVFETHMPCPPEPDPPTMRVPTGRGTAPETLDHEADKTFGGTDREQAA